jgi:hypothetical protein
MIRCLLVFLTGLGSLQEDPARESGASRAVSVRDGEVVRLQIRPSEPGRVFLTAVTFPEAITHVVSAWDPKDLSLEHEANRLFIKLLGKAEGSLDVILSGGAHVRLFLAGVPAPAPYDGTVAVNRIAPPPPGPDAPPRRASASGALELAKAMRLGQVPPDATVRSGGNAVLFRRTDIEVSLHYVYETGRYRGFVLGLANRSDRQAYHVDLARFGGEDLVLVGARDVVVPPGKATRLYVVDWK